MTYEKLTEHFPFGWIVYALNEATTTYDPIVYDKLIWDASWKQLKFECDFSKGTAMVTLPGDLQIITPDGKPVLATRNNSFRGTISLQPGSQSAFNGIRAGANMPSLPDLIILTLSNNQRKPVFAVGFRLR